MSIHLTSIHATGPSAARRAKAAALAFVHAAILLAMGGNTLAASRSTDFDVSFRVALSCTVDNTTLNFGAANTALTSPVDAGATIIVRCADGVNYTIGLDGGTSGTVNNRLLTRQNSTETIGYTLHWNVRRNRVAGNSGARLFSRRATGNDDTIEVFGRIPAAPFGAGNTPPAGTYTDRVRITLTY